MKGCCSSPEILIVDEALLTENMSCLTETFYKDRWKDGGKTLTLELALVVTQYSYPLL